MASLLQPVPDSSAFGCSPSVTKERKSQFLSFVIFHFLLVNKLTQGELTSDREYVLRETHSLCCRLSDVQMSVE